MLRSLTLAALLTVVPAVAHDMAGMGPGSHEALEAALADTSAFGEKGDPAKATRTVPVDATEIRYDIADLAVAAGETITFIVTNDGEQPHEFTIGDAAYQDAARRMMAMMGGGASPAHEAMHAAAGNTLILQPGETKALTWRFTRSGSFLFACNFTGHAEAGMVGSVTVR